MLRTATERLTRRVCFRRRLPTNFGRGAVWVSPSAGLRFLFSHIKSIDPSLFNWVREFVRKDNIVWDIGANVGLFSFSSAHLAGSNGLIVAIEADPWLVQLLRKSSRLQPSSSAPVHIVSAAVAKSVDLRTFHIASRSRSTNYLMGYGSTQAGEVAETQIVVTVSLDWLSERYGLPDLIKIDVEGAELEVLLGASTLLEKKRPILLCEVTAETAAEVTRFLRKKEYRLFDGDVSAAARKELDSAPWNTIALPA